MEERVLGFVIVVSRYCWVEKGDDVLVRVEGIMVDECSLVRI